MRDTIFALASGAVPCAVAVQGNLDPLALVAGGVCLDREIDLIKSIFGKNPYVFNLGHGILPETPVSHVEHLIKRVRELG